jgi:Tol biopolymer transport system component
MGGIIRRQEVSMPRAMAAGVGPRPVLRADRVGPRTVLRAGALLAVAGLLIVAATATASARDPRPTSTPATATAGLGAGPAIAYAVVLGDHGRIELIDPDGSGRRTVWRGGWIARSPAWSPSGDRLAFVALGGTTPSGGPISDVHVLAADGSDRIVASHPDVVAAFDWLDDGRLVVAWQRGEIVVLDMAGGPKTWLRRPDGSRPWRAVASPDTRHVAVVSGARDASTGATTPRLVVYGAPGWTAHAVPLEALDVCWSPDGRSLAVATPMGVTRMDIADGSLHQVGVTDGTTAGVPAIRWSGDGGRVIALVALDGQPSRLVSIRADASAADLLSPGIDVLTLETDLGGYDSKAFAQPGPGSRLAFTSLTDPPRYDIVEANGLLVRDATAAVGASTLIQDLRPLMWSTATDGSGVAMSSWQRLASLDTVTMTVRWLVTAVNGEDIVGGSWRPGP